MHSCPDTDIDPFVLIISLKKREYFKAFSVINQRYFISHTTSYKALKFSTVLV